MALFDSMAPPETRYTPLQVATGQAKSRLALTGYKPDGSQNLWGRITSWIPGAGVTTNLAAQRIAKQEGLTGVAGNIADDADNRMSKLIAQLGIVQAGAGLFTGNLQMARSGFTNAVSGVAGSVGSGNRPNYEDDGRTVLY